MVTTPASATRRRTEINPREKSARSKHRVTVGESAQDVVFSSSKRVVMASVSVIVPVLNEAGLIAGFLGQIRRLGPDMEIIVVDGGSSDETISIAKRLADQLIEAPRGRASQMNAGAAAATAEVFWFLHADLTPPPNSIDQIRTALSAPDVANLTPNSLPPAAGFACISRIPHENEEVPCPSNGVHFALMKTY